MKKIESGKIYFCDSCEKNRCNENKISEYKIFIY